MPFVKGGVNAKKRSPYDGRASGRGTGRRPKRIRREQLRQKAAATNSAAAATMMEQNVASTPVATPPANNAFSPSSYFTPQQPRQAKIKAVALLSKSSKTEQGLTDSYDWQEKRRVAIEYKYRKLMSSPDPTNDVIRQICVHLEEDYSKARTSVRRIVNRIRISEQFGIPYNMSRQQREYKGNLLPDGCPEIQIIADQIEYGNGARMAVEAVNIYRSEMNKPRVGYSSVYSIIDKLQPKISTIKSRKQGSLDADSNWAKARFQWVMQLLYRFDMLSLSDVVANYAEQPNWIEDVGTKKIVITQIAFWDETHKKVIRGAVNTGGTAICVKFKRDANGKLDSENGTYADDSTRLKMKYPEEIRLSLGVAQVELPNGAIEGRRAAAYVYSAAIILSLSDTRKKEREKVLELKNSVIDSNVWVLNRRKESDLWQDEPVNQIKGIAGKTKEKLATILNVNTVGDLAKLRDDLLGALPKVSSGTLSKYRDIARAAHPGSVPSNLKFDHRKNPDEYDPFISLFGPIEGPVKRRQAALGRRFVCITDMVDHMFKETEKIFKGTKHEDDWMVYHDALSLMTAVECRQWMQEKGYLKRWVLPININIGTRYANRPIGNSPEMMPLDTHCNKYLDDAVRRCIAMTTGLRNDDKRKFLMDTPTNGTRAYLRVWNSPVLKDIDGADVTGGYPTSDLIINDTNKFLSSCMEIYKQKGVCIQGLGNRSGWRGEGTRKKNTWGGKRTKRVVDNVKWVHPDAFAARKESISTSIDRHEQRSVLDIESVPLPEDSFIEDDDCFDGNFKLEETDLDAFI